MHNDAQLIEMKPLFGFFLFIPFNCTLSGDRNGGKYHLNFHFLQFGSIMQSFLLQSLMISYRLLSRLTITNVTRMHHLIYLRLHLVIWYVCIMHMHSSIRETTLCLKSTHTKRPNENQMTREWEMKIDFEGCSRCAAHSHKIFSLIERDCPLWNRC